MTRSLCLIGQSGPVSEALQQTVRQDGRVDLTVLSAQDALAHPALGDHPAVRASELLVLCVQDFASPQLVPRLPDTTRVLDISPAFRTHPDWVYGLAELPGAPERIRLAHRVANPGCFACAALLALAPLQRAGLLSGQPLLYLDGVGGYSTGGSALVDKAQRGELAPEAVYSLSKPHRHIEEIRHVGGFASPIWFTPKVGAYPRGIRLQVPLPGVAPDTARDVLASAYAATAITVHSDCPPRLAGDAWAHRPGAGLYVMAQASGCVVISVLDNLGKGAVESAWTNCRLMLGLDGPADPNRGQPA